MRSCRDCQAPIDRFERCTECKRLRNLAANKRFRERQKLLVGKIGPCSKCGKQAPLRLRSAELSCEECYIKDGRRIGAQSRGKIRQIIRAAKDRPCVDCGRTYPFYVMDFDHRPGEEKKFNVSAVAVVGREKVLAEIAKCDVVCSNCHRERTWKREHE